jgi:hypothetical protein
MQMRGEDLRGCLGCEGGVGSNQPLASGSSRVLRTRASPLEELKYKASWNF